MSKGSIKIIRNHDDPFAHIERSILRDNRMSLAERGFFALVLSLPTNREMTLMYFAKVSGANKETIGKYFHKLEELGYLKRYQERGNHGIFGATIYEFTTGAPCTDFPATAEPCTANPSLKKERKKDNNPLEPPSGGLRVPEPAKWKPERFEKFWTFYRQNVNDANRSAARKAWDKLKPDDETIDCIAHALVVRLRVDDEWKRGIGRPHASTYLNGSMWLDEPALPATPQQTAPALTEEDEIIA